MFEIFDSSGWVWKSNVNGPVLFATFLEAKAFIEANDLTGTYKPRKIRETSGAPAWHVREEKRLEQGVYTAVPFTVQSAWRAIVESNPFHFVHVSRKQTGKLAYTESAKKGEGDVQTPIALDAYLTKYAPNMDSEERDSLLAIWAGSRDSADVEFIRSGANMAEFMRDNNEGDLHSCMSDHPLSRHPYRVYGADSVDGVASDLTLAALKKADDVVIARCLVWEEKKVFGRVYGDTALSTALRALGFRPGEFNGARLKRIAYRDAFVMPYLDGIQSVDDCGDHFKIARDGAFQCEETCGYISPDDERYVCEACDTRISQTYQIRTGRTDWQDWCESCASDTFHCDGTGDRWADSCSSVEIGDRLYSTHYAECHFHQCERTGDWCESTSEVIVNEDGGTECWGDDGLENNAFTCRHDGALYANEMLSRAMSKNEETICFLNDERDSRYHAIEAQTALLLEAPATWTLGSRVRHNVEGCGEIIRVNIGDSKNTYLVRYDGRHSGVWSLNSSLTLVRLNRAIEAPAKTPAFSVGDHVIIALVEPQDCTFCDATDIGRGGIIKYVDRDSPQYQVRFDDSHAAWFRAEQLILNATAETIAA